MVNKVKSINKFWGEVAPTLLVLQSHYKRSSRCSKLEPIIEEEPRGAGILNKGVFVSMPLLLSGFLYIFLFRGLSI
ncbi:hypothetical protein AAZX31_09G084900 [Glycine max]|uniref:Uncharacterized protein n=1 Tax=Glycine max TaxID=3847 RepID=K7LCP5_SOYBN|nr:hypothetical protein JHK87_024453 [Glycine soja]KAG5006526.1 hypothetical protein JHK85_025068 [Glycine max]KAG5012306.1 hypothetical protein JHK86_024567 [Glycine max]KAG5133285.1 hypothetical protein JHK82_024473 [Glycine max]KAH1042198.1 hypothetical protein GYH30_024488 [Glycine max]